MQCNCVTSKNIQCKSNIYKGNTKYCYQHFKYGCKNDSTKLPTELPKASTELPRSSTKVPKAFTELPKVSTKVPTELAK